MSQYQALTQLLIIVRKDDPGVTGPDSAMAGQAFNGGASPGLSNGGALRISVNDPNLYPNDCNSSNAAQWGRCYSTVVQHEFGHVLGLGHAADSTCPGPTYDGSFTGANPTCTHYDYGDKYDVMGAAGVGSAQALSGYRKAQLGLLEPDVGFVSVTTLSSQSFTLAPLEDQDYSLLNEVEITDPTDTSMVYSIEFRREKGVRILRVFPYGNSMLTSYLSPSLASKQGGQGEFLQEGDSFASVTGQVHVVVESVNNARAIVSVFIGSAPVASVGSVTLSGLAVVGSTLSAVLSDVVPSTATLTYTWARGQCQYGGGRQISGATGSSYVLTSADGGCQIWVTVVAFASGYVTTVIGSAMSSEVSRLSSIGSVVVTGAAAVGSTLNVSVASVVPTGASLAYQWYRDSVVISGATSSSYVVTSADYGSQVKACVTSTAAGYSSATVCGAQGSVLVGSVTLSTGTGPHTAGTREAFMVSNVVPASATVTYQWYRGDVAIPGASGTISLDSTGSGVCQYGLCGWYWTTEDDADYDIHAVVTASATGYSTITASSPHVSILRSASIGAVTLSGTPTVGSTLTVSVTDLIPSGVNVSYTWTRMSGTTTIANIQWEGDQYVVTSADVGYQIRAYVQVSQSGYYHAYGYSPITSVVTEPSPLALIGSVTLSRHHAGMAVGRSVSVSVEDVTPSTATLSYQWYRGKGETIIPGATGASYTPTDADVGYPLLVAVTASAAGYAPVTVTVASSSLEVVGQATPSIDPLVLSGSLTVGSTLSVIVTNPVPVDISLTYQWNRWSGNMMTAIEGATDSSYVVTSVDVGWRLSVTVTIQRTYCVSTGMCTHASAGYGASSNVVIT
jgi:hypothetical protein